MALRISIVFLLLAAVPLFAQPDAPKGGSLPGEEKRTRDDLDNAAKLAADQRWDDATRRYQQILAESGDLLVPVDANRSLPARWIVHQRLAALPPEARKIYRDRIDDTAKKWLEQGSAQRDVRLLEQVIAEAFCSSAGEQALHLLGDLALERGEFESAERYWRMLARPASRLKPPAEKKPEDPPSFELLYPDPKDKGALARAKQVLALALRGEKDQATAELLAFSKLHQSEEGFLAGRKGKYAEILQALLKADERWNQAAAVPAGSTWHTFAGDPSRNYRLANVHSPYWPDFPLWQTPLPTDPAAKAHRETDPPLGTGAASLALAIHPVIVPGYVLVADSLRVTAYHLLTGKLAGQYDHRHDKDNKNAVPEALDLRLPSHNDARYTLTVAGNRVYARLGATAMKPPDDNNKPGESDNWLVCLGLERDAGGEMKLQYRWQIRARMLDTDPVALFEGTPVAHEGRLYMARTRFDGRQVVTSIDCYDADAPDGRKEPPPRRWQQDVWIMEQGKASEAVRHRHDLLTMAGPFVVYCTHSGAIIALDATSGKRMWAYRYPAAVGKQPDGVLPRDLCPSVYAAGRIYAAPADADRIFCLNATTGGKIWESSPVNVVHLVGVARDRLFATLGGYPKGIRCYDTARGNILWTKPDEGDRAPHGRGFLTDQWVFWPTRQGLKVLRQEDGEPQDASSSTEPWGNIAFGENCMIVTTATEMWGFIPERFRLSFRQEAVKEWPEDALAQYQLALALADAGREEEAMARLVRAVEKARDEDHHRGRSVRELALRRLQELRLAKVERLWKENQKDEATALLVEFTNEMFPIPERVRAQILLMQKLQRTYPWLLELNTIDALSVEGADGKRHYSNGFPVLWFTSADGIPIAGDDLLVSLMGDTAWWIFENRESQLVGPKQMLRIPWAGFSRELLLAQALGRERAGDLAGATLCYRRLLYGTFWERDARRALDHQKAARQGLLHIYETTGNWGAARDLRWYIAQQSSEKPNYRRGSPILINAPEISPPLTKENAFDLATFREWPLQPLIDAPVDELQPAITEEGVAFFGHDRQVVCRSLGKKDPLWLKELRHEAEFFTLHADTVIVAGPMGLTRLRRSDGLLLWEVLAPEPQPMPGKVPYAIFRTMAEPALPKPFSAFRLAGTRMFMLHGGQKLLALDVEAGRFLWQRWAPGAPILDTEEGAGFSEHYLATDDVILLQTTNGRYFGVDAVTGRVMYRQEHDSARWNCPPVLLENQRAVFPLDAEHIVCMDLATGNFLWNKPIDGWPSLAGTAAQIRRDGSNLLIVVERNFGYEFERWNLETGKRNLGLVFLGRERVDLARAGITTEGYVFANGKTVRAISRDDGKLLWTMPLPASGRIGWHVRAIRGAVLVYPDEALPETVASVPLPWPAQYHVFMRREFPLLVVDAKTGKVLQEFKTPANGPRACVLLGQQQAAFAVEGALWRLKDTK